MKTIIAYLYSILLFLGSISQCLSQDIIYDLTNDSMSKNKPRFCAVVGDSVKVLPLSEHRKSRAQNIIRNAVSKYSKRLIKSLVKEIFVLDTIIYYRHGISGLNDCRGIYLAINNKYNDTYTEQTFHHEIAHILQLDYRFKKYFNRKKWESINPKDFKYIGNALKAINTSTLTDMNRNEYEKGFVRGYSMANVNEDFTEVCAILFKLENDDIKELFRKYKRLRKKMKFAIKFYHEIDERYTKKYFIRISKK